MKKISNSNKYQNFVNKLERLLCSSKQKTVASGQAGFSLIEVTIAMVIFLIAVLGVFVSLAYAMNYNSGNSARAQALSILQKKVEIMRSKRFIPGQMDPDLTSGDKPDEIVTGDDGHNYRINVTVDDDPFTVGLQNNQFTMFKEINITVSLERPTPGWQTSVPTTVVLRRVRGN